MRHVIVKRSILVNVTLSAEKKKMFSQLSLTDIELQSHTFETRIFIDNLCSMRHFIVYSNSSIAVASKKLNVHANDVNRISYVS